MLSKSKSGMIKPNTNRSNCEVLEGKNKMKKTKIALKPYLNTIAEHCSALSTKELTGVIISLAKDVPTSDRVQFLEKIESCLPGRKSAMVPEADPVEQILDDIEALKENIEERIDSIENGSYWDDPDDWRYDNYYDEEPDYISEDQLNELESFFNSAEDLFMDDKLEDARKVYNDLFTLISYVKENAYFSLGHEIDIREARARYCRCVYDTLDTDKRLDAFAEAMEIDGFSSHNENEYDENYPLLQDVIDARPDEMADMELFLPAWKNVLATKEIKGRAAVLLLETVNRLEGIDGVSRLAKKWKNNQPQGYLFWLNILKEKNDHKGIVKVGTEGLKALKQGRFRERVAEFIIDAAAKLNDTKMLLMGRRERLFSRVNDQNLLDLVNQAIKQDARDKELGGVIKHFKSRKTMDDDQKTLYVKALLMAGQLHDAFDMAKKEKSVGWSYHSNAGVVFGSVLSVLSDHSEKADIIKTLLKKYANQRCIYSERFSVDDEEAASFYEEIISGLKQKKITDTNKTKYLKWSEKIGKNRIEHIVSNKHRRAYARAAQVLGSLAEAYTTMGQKNKAVKILHKFYNEKYNRFSAFRREVKAVVTDSNLLKNLGFLK
jgi:DNA primase large subunit